MDRTLVDTGMLPAALVERCDERIRTLEDALRPFAIEADEQAHGYDTDEPLAPDCISCHEPRPCKHETARRALEREG